MRGRMMLRQGYADVELLGHAQSAVVCAGISTLCYAVMSAIEEHIEEGAVYQPGTVRFRACINAVSFEALRVLAIGLQALKEQFPEDVDVTTEGEWRV